MHNDEIPEDAINRLHSRHLAKIINQLKEINTAQVIIHSVRLQLTYYTADIKKIIASIQCNNDSGNTK